MKTDFCRTLKLFCTNLIIKILSEKYLFTFRKTTCLTFLQLFHNNLSAVLGDKTDDASFSQINPFKKIGDFGSFNIDDNTPVLGSAQDFKSHDIVLLHYFQSFVQKRMNVYPAFNTLTVFNLFSMLHQKAIRARTRSCCKDIDTRFRNNMYIINKRNGSTRRYHIRVYIAHDFL